MSLRLLLVLFRQFIALTGFSFFLLLLAYLIIAVMSIIMFGFVLLAFHAGNYDTVPFQGLFDWAIEVYLRRQFLFGISQASIELGIIALLLGLFLTGRKVKKVEVSLLDFVVAPLKVQEQTVPMSHSEVVLRRSERVWFFVGLLCACIMCVSLSM